MHEDQIHVDILSGEQKKGGFSVRFPDSTLDGRERERETARWTRGESVLYIFSAIEQSPAPRQRDGLPREREREGGRKAGTDGWMDGGKWRTREPGCALRYGGGFVPSAVSPPRTP